MKVLLYVYAFLFALNCSYGQHEFLVSEANTLGGLYIDSDTLYVVSAADRAHRKSINNEESNFDTFNLALLGPGYYNYRDICKIGNFLYVTKHGSPSNGQPGIYRLDLSDDSAFFQLYIALNEAYGLASRGQELYVNSGNDIYKINVDDSNPELVAINSSIFEFTFGVGTLALKVLGDYLYVGNDNGILRINLEEESYASEYVSDYEGWGMALKDDNTMFLTFNDNLNQFGTVYQLKLDTQEYTELYTISGFIQTYDIEYHNNALFVTTLSGSNNTVVRLDLNNLSTDKHFKPKLSLYPNPAVNSISITGLNQIQPYTIYKSSGVKIDQGEVFKASINVSDLSSGLYVIQLGTETVLKFVKQ